MNNFWRFAKKISEFTGSSQVFLVAVGVILIWVVLGPVFGYSDTWQLIINTGTTIITFLMVFLIQNTQNRESKAIHLKLDELLFSIKKARNELINLENQSDEKLTELREGFEKLK